MVECSNSSGYRARQRRFECQPQYVYRETGYAAMELAKQSLSMVYGSRRRIKASGDI